MGNLLGPFQFSYFFLELGFGDFVFVSQITANHNVVGDKDHHVFATPLPLFIVGKTFWADVEVVLTLGKKLLHIRFFFQKLLHFVADIARNVVFFFFLLHISDTPGCFFDIHNFNLW